ncbi:MAG: DUF3422 domain-containing protein [Casimicrobiaceae bacterium]|nr:DUF3422 domain-containing protein [Casimicrobiaceae bacterium]MCX8097640.1 DUF3422 domain-containing protein [Casimicrobiaceae bacterium]MDW8311936.1 DUF3422 domain-containing protein [Burkholderiales bacterium]
MIPTHPLRATLHNEIHARPPEALARRVSVLHLVMLANPEERRASRAHLERLLADSHAPRPAAEDGHFRADLPGYRIRWEQHTEFVSWTFFRVLDEHFPVLERLASAKDVIPAEWLAELPGQALCKIELAAVPLAVMRERIPERARFDEATLVGARVLGEQAEVLTDFQIHSDGFTRFLVGMAPTMPPRQRGRLVQSLLEVETYRMMGLLGLPVARQAGPILAQAERDLAELAEAIRAAERETEAQLLDRLTRLAATVESLYATTHSRFSATQAYFELVDKRLAFLGESKLGSLPTLGAFVERRVAPARSTCAWTAHRLDLLSQRISRMSNLLRTRVEIDQQQSSRDLLSAMNARQRLQLKLQTAVEGLSVAAISYYIVGLIAYAADGLVKLGWPYSAKVTAAASIPVVVLGVAWSMRRLHKRLLRD